MKIQAVSFSGLTTLDLIGPLQPLAYLPNSDIEIVAETAGELPTDAGVTIVAQKTFREATSYPDILVVPGGGTPAIDQLENRNILEFIAEQGERAQWIVSVCTGALLLGAAGLLRGYRAATYWSMMETLEGFGAIPTYQRVVFDRNRCTGGGLTAGIDVGIAIAGAVAGERVGRELELMLEYNPEPPYNTGHPDIAPPDLVASVRSKVDQVMQPTRVKEIASSINDESSRLAKRNHTRERLTQND